MSVLTEILRAGHRSFLDSFKSAGERYRELAEEGQSPAALVIACCDSRSAPEAVFDSEPGEVFVLRNVANIVPSYQPDANLHGTSAAIEYAVQVLSVPHIVVLGHAGCGGIQAAMQADQNQQDTAFIGNWVNQIVPLASEVLGDAGSLDSRERSTIVERLSIVQSLANLRTFPFIAERERNGTLQLHGAWFDIGVGTLWVLDDGNWTSSL